MDYQTIAIVAGVVGASAGSLAILWRMANRAPLGYQDENGFHYGEPPARTGCAVPPAGWDCTRAPGHDGPCAAIPANSNVPHLTETERAVLEVMHPEFGHSAAKISKWTGVPAGRVSNAQRQLRSMGLADFGPLFSEDDGKLAGRGYWLTPQGAALQAQLRAKAVA